MPDDHPVPTADRAFLSPHADDGSCGDATSAGPDGLACVVYATRGEQAIVAECPTRDDAWGRAADEARAASDAAVDPRLLRSESDGHR
jgi:hypothetical protein